MTKCTFCKNIHNRKGLFCSKQCKDKQWYQNSKEHKKQYFLDNREHIRKREQQYHLQNKEVRNLNGRKYYARNCEKIKANKSEYCKHNRDKINMYHNKYYQDINNRLRKNLRGRLSCAISRGFDGSRGGSFVKDLGCPIKEFKVYIEKQFQPGMTWDNYGWGDDKWHLDHIVALIKFNLTNPEQFKKAAHYTNYQPLWQLDNFKKGSR